MVGVALIELASWKGFYSAQRITVLAELPMHTVHSFIYHTLHRNRRLFDRVWSTTGSLYHAQNRNYTLQVAQLSPRDRAAAWVSCGANINVDLRIQRTLL